MGKMKVPLVFKLGIKMLGLQRQRVQTPWFWVVVTVFALVLLDFPSASSRVFAATINEYLVHSRRPHFQKGHKLPPLTRWGWGLPLDAKIELAENWGYALELGAANNELLRQLEDPQSESSQLVALTHKNPDKFSVFVLVDRPLLDEKTQDALPEQTWIKLQKPIFMDVPRWKLWSPEAPDAIFAQAAHQTAVVLQKLKEKTKISVILNGGEYGLGYFGHSGKYWVQDATVLQAKGNLSWFDYISCQKARQEMFITEAIRQAVPDRQLYLWYHFGGLPSWDPWQWSYKYDYMRKVSDMPGQSLYYLEFNSGWIGDKDLLSQALTAATQAQEFGDFYSYNWVCGGWLDGKFSDPERYTGFLKCLYATGMVGAVAGYFSYPEKGFAADPGDTVPSWMWQLIQLAHVHALFSHLEDFIYNGSLVVSARQNLDNRVDSEKFDLLDKKNGVRGLSRKHHSREEWLLVVWAADGLTRNVFVTIPNLGEVEVLARASGAVYLVKHGAEKASEQAAVTATLIDADGMLPTENISIN